MATQPAPSTAPGQFMQCMEVWGGNQPMDAGVAMAGLDAWVYCKPFHDADGGGDVYYVSSCATGRITRLLIADVSGHGAEVSKTGATLRSLMRRFVNYLDQTEFVRALNAEFTALSAVDCFATAIVITFFGPTSQVTLCNAGHPPPLVFRKREECWGYLDSDTLCGGNIPWGIEDIGEYEQFDTRLRVGDLVLCYTDSLIEARLPDGELLGFEGLLRIIRGLDAADPSTLIARLLAAFAAEGCVMSDDITVLLFRPNGLAQRAPFGQRVMAPVRLLGALARSMRSGGEPMPWPDLTLANIGGVIFRPFERLWGKDRPASRRDR